MQVRQTKYFIPRCSFVVRYSSLLLLRWHPVMWRIFSAHWDYAPKWHLSGAARFFQQAGKLYWHAGMAGFFPRSLVLVGFSAVKVVCMICSARTVTLSSLSGCFVHPAPKHIDLISASKIDCGIFLTLDTLHLKDTVN